MGRTDSVMPSPPSAMSADLIVPFLMSAPWTELFLICAEPIVGNNPPPIEVTVKLDSQTGMARVFAEKQVVDEVFEPGAAAARSATSRCTR